MSRREITHIGPYALEEKLASGGFGNIWKARDGDTGEHVAIKILHPELVVSQAIMMRFEREALAISMLRHPNVVELRHFDKLENDRPYLVMEFLHGPNLEHYVREHGALRPRHVLGILEQLCSALAAAHAMNIVHRDLKASNVVLDRGRSRERVVLLDFGIVKLLETDGPDITASRVTLGSPVCMAPEQIQGHAVDARTDVYALGSLTFLMLTGELPFPGRSMDTMHQHLISPRPRPSDRMDLSPVYDDVVLRAMAKKPAHRFSSVTEFLAAVRSTIELAETSSAVIEIPALEVGRDEATFRCVGLYVDVSVPSDVLAVADDRLLDEMDGIYPKAAGYLESNGFSLAYESGDSALFFMPLPEEANEELAIRANAVCHARELLTLLTPRDARIRISLHVHVDQADFSMGLVTGGPLLEIARWVEAGDATRVSVSPDAARGLEEWDV